jgi:hypothetical protein
MTEITVILKFFCFELNYFSNSLYLSCRSNFALSQHFILFTGGRGGRRSALRMQETSEKFRHQCLLAFFPDTAFKKRIEFGSGSESINFFAKSSSLSIPKNEVLHIFL